MERREELHKQWKSDTKNLMMVKFVVWVWKWNKFSGFLSNFWNTILSGKSWSGCILHENCQTSSRWSLSEVITITYNTTAQFFLISYSSEGEITSLWIACSLFLCAIFVNFQKHCSLVITKIKVVIRKKLSTKNLKILTYISSLSNIPAVADRVKVIHLVVNLKVLDAARISGVHLKKMISVAKWASATQNDRLCKSDPRKQPLKLNN